MEGTGIVQLKMQKSFAWSQSTQYGNFINFCCTSWFNNLMIRLELYLHLHAAVLSLSLQLKVKS